MLNSTASNTGRRSATVAPAPPTAAAFAPNSHHAVELSPAPRAWPAASEMLVSIRLAESQPAYAGGRCLNERTCTWAAYGLITGVIFGGAAGAAAVLMARASGEHTTLDPVQGGAVGAIAGAVMGSVFGCMANACCGDPE